MPPRSQRLVFLAGLLCSGLAGAQGSQGQSFSAQRLRPVEDSQGLLTTHSGEIPQHLNWDIGLTLDYANNPLVLRRNNERVGALLAHRVGGELSFSIGLFNYFSIEAAMPTVLFQSRGETPGVDPSSLGELMLAGLSDFRLVPKLRLLREDKHGVSLSLMPTITLPAGLLQSSLTGASPSYLGEAGVTFAPELALSTRRIAGTLIALNLSYRLRGTTHFQNLLIRDELLFHLGLGYDIATLAAEVPLMVMLELSGGTSASAPFGNYVQTPLEWLLGLRYTPLPGVQVSLAGGTGIVAGYGTPDFRVLGGLRYGMHEKDSDADGLIDSADGCVDDPEDLDGFEDSDGCPDPDNDDDTILDAADACPLDAEDLDGFEDSDGCPDPDNDQDGIADGDDACPNEAGSAEFKGCSAPDSDGDGLVDPKDGCPQEAEDRDGFEDSDGCPDPDNDGDGLLDGDDKCPDQAEDLDNFEDVDGCPDPDNDQDSVLDTNDLCPLQPAPPERAAQGNGCPPKDSDGDGLMDEADKCPEQAEDADGFEDDDGCPDPDNDKDGVPDVSDQCPLEPEVINGVKDDDGCPDKGRQVVILKKDKIEILQKVFFKSGSARILKKSYSLLDQVAQVIKGHNEIGLLSVEGHTDSRGRAKYNKRLSQKRAESVALYMVEAGIPPSRLKPIGYGEEQPIADNKTKKGREQNRRVEFNILR